MTFYMHIAQFKTLNKYYLLALLLSLTVNTVNYIRLDSSGWRNDILIYQKESRPKASQN